MSTQSTSDTSEIAWLATHKAGFGRVADADDFLHSDVQLEDFTLTETYWFNFYVPERGLSGALYCWMHKNLGTCTSGVWVYQGLKSHHLQCEHFNVQQHLPYPTREGRMVTVPHIGIEIEVLEPLKRHALRYRDAATGTALELWTSALMPPAVRGNGFHFEQAMRISGTLTLAGEKIPVDSMTVRDRSWGQARSEDPAKHPPLDWSVGVLDNGATAFNILACDDPTRHPGWRERYHMTPEKALRDGWIYHNATLEHITRLSQFIERDSAHMHVPTGYHCEFETASGTRHVLDGRVVSRCPWGVWPNLHSSFNFVEWTLDGRSGWGDLQDSYWIEFLR